MVEEKEYLLTSQEILGGIKFAVEKGETLKNAMMSFYRAGYGKQEIEEAAKTYLEMNNPGQMDVTKRIPEKKVESKNEKLVTNVGVKPGEKKEEVKQVDKKVEEKKVESKNEKPVTNVGVKPGEKKEEENKIKPLTGNSVENKNPSAMPKPKGSQNLGQKNNKETVQKVSEYGTVIKAPKKGKLITLVLILILVFLFGILGAIILFKSELVSFFNNLFG